MSGIAITHIIEPVLPGRCAVLTVGGMTDSARLYSVALADGPSKFPGDGLAAATSAPVEVPILQRQGECLTVDIPVGPYAAMAFGLSPSFDPKTAWIANRPRLDWSWPARTVIGEPLRLIGRNLVSIEHYPTIDPTRPVSFGGLLEGKTRIVARRIGSEGESVQFLELHVARSSAYEAHIDVPKVLLPGRYELFAHNGLGGAFGWSAPLAMDLAEPERWPARVFRVDDFARAGEPSASDAIDRALAALAQNGGGILEFSDRVYSITRTIVLPGRTVLRGAGSNRTLLSTPASGGPQPPYVVITGDSDFVVEDIRVVTVYSTVIVCAPKLVPASFDEAFNIPFNYSCDLRTRNVAVRRCHFVQRINAHCDRRDDKDHVARMTRYVTSQGEGCSGFNAILMRGDAMEFADNTIFGGGSCIVMHGCTSVRVAGNTLKVGPAGHGICAMAKLTWPKDFRTTGGPGAKIIGNYCRDVLVEDNVVSGYSERARDLVYFLYGAENGHVARNRICDIECTFDAEGLGLHLFSARWREPTLRMLSPTRGQIIDPTGEVKNECLNDAVIDIVAGRGVGQMRRILRRDGDFVEIDRPWIVDPDETSDVVFTAPTPFHNMTVIDNVLYNTGANIIFWGCSNDTVIDGNYSGDAAGIAIWSVRLDPSQKVWGGAAFSQVINNVIDARSWLFTLCGKYGPETDEGYDYLGLIIRGNHATNNSSISVKTTFPQTGSDQPWHVDHRGLVLEDNLCTRRSTVRVQEGTTIIERRNRME